MRSLAFLGLFLAACGSAAEAPPVLTGPRGPRPLVLREKKLGVMGTSLSIGALGQDAGDLDRAIDAAIREMQRIEDLMTTWRDSPLTRLNAAAGEGPQVVPPELAHMVARACDVGRMTGGAFDPTFAGVGRLWDFKRAPPLVPDAAAVDAALASVDYSKIRVDLDANTVELPAGMSIGLGGIAKGYGVDRATKVLIEHGVQHGIVDAGGDLKAMGKKHGELWQIAIRHPRDRERVLAVIPVSNVCVVTSGDYERFFEVEGVRYHHILDPRTGYPSTGCMSATVTGPDAAGADALATALAVLGPEAGLALIEGVPRFEALLVGMDGAVHASSGMHANMTDSR